MGCLRAEKILDYVCDPLRKCLQDDNPYVRKTAAIGVAKLYDLKPTLAMENGFVGQLKEMVADSNPMVSSLCIRPFLLLIIIIVSTGLFSHGLLFINII
jgi:vesicle coat complex subunit